MVPKRSRPCAEMPSLTSYLYLYRHSYSQAQQTRIMFKSKTTWTAITGALAGVAGYFTGELELGAAANVVITSLLALFLRHGIKKTEKAVTGE